MMEFLSLTPVVGCTASLSTVVAMPALAYPRRIRTAIAFGMGLLSVGSLALLFVPAVAGFPAALPIWSGLQTTGGVALTGVCLRSRRQRGAEAVVKAAALLAAISAAVLVDLVLLEVLYHRFRYAPVLTGTITAGVALMAHGFLAARIGRSRSERTFVACLREEFGLTRAEAGICVEVSNGIAREDIYRRLRIVPGTLKIHLNHIYAKTIDRNGPSGGKREKLRHLTIFLHELRARAAEQENGGDGP